MEKSIRKLALVAFVAIIFAHSAIAADTVSVESEGIISVKKCLARDFHINVESNKDVYHNRDVLKLAVKLINNSPQPVFIGLCPVEAVPVEVNEVEIEDVFEGVLDDLDVDVAIIPYRPRIIGYATLTRLGPSPVPYLVPYAEEASIVKPVPKKTKKIRLPLFGSPRVPSHSTRIISTANILLACPLLEEAEAVPLETEPAEAKEIEIIPAIARYIALKPGYYLLDCHIEKICGTRKAQAQKIIQIRRRILKPVQAEPVPTNLVKPAPVK